MTKLNLGCGTTIRSGNGWVNVDMIDIPGVDVVHNLDTHPWPWPDDSVDLIVAEDLFEHVTDPIGFMTEAWRVLRPNGPGELMLRTPHWSAEHAYTDPTHRRFATEYTWDYWVPGTVLFETHNAVYGGVSFQKKEIRLKFGTLYVWLTKC